MYVVARFLYFFFLDLYFCFVHYPVYINSFSKNCFYGLYQLRTEVPPKIQRLIWELILMHLPSTKMLAQYLVEVLSTALNSLVAGLTSLKIWSTKCAKKRHLCASISAHSLHREGPHPDWNFLSKTEKITDFTDSNPFYWASITAQTPLINWSLHIIVRMVTSCS